MWIERRKERDFLEENAGCILEEHVITINHGRSFLFLRRVNDSLILVLAVIDEWRKKTNVFKEFTYQ
jgi:hypothetical protein